MADEVNEKTGRPTIDAIHRDVALANQYRLELLKLLMTLSAGILAFTVTFRPGLRVIRFEWLMWIGWIALGVSMVGGMGHMVGWDRFYISYRDWDWHLKFEEGKRRRKSITKFRRSAMYSQYIGFALGVLSVALFAATNFSAAGSVGLRP